MEVRKAALEENGYVENLTLLGYIVSIYILVRRGGTDWVKSHWCLTAIPLLFLAREADLHAKYTEFSVFGTKYFFSGSVSAISLVIGAAVVILVFVVFASVMHRYYAVFFQSLRNRETDAIFIAVALVFAVGSKLIDGTARKIDAWGLSLNENGEILTLLFEETLELGISLAFCFAAHNYFHKTLKVHRIR
ncbi:MAG: hypothetical protein KTR18_03310 [Acidiferrobacterales bacterium]|nr:hypothetical protein [Acidiferrobacterales bacterium]